MESIRTRAMSILACVLLVLVAAAPSTTACSCTEWPSFQQAFGESQAVFRGIVTAIRSAGPEYYGYIWVTLQVDGWWKGEPPPTAEILTAENEAACGFTFLAASEYLVYALRWNQTGPLWTHLCWRTHLIWPEDPDLFELGPPHPVPVTPQAWGVVKALYR